VTHILLNSIPHMRLRATDTQESEGITWLLHTVWRVPHGQKALLLHTQVLMHTQSTHSGGAGLVDAVLRDPASVAKRDAPLSEHPNAVCPTCGGWAALGMTTAGNRGPALYTSLSDTPWCCPLCPRSLRAPAPGPTSAHACMVIEARWAATPPERFRW